ncbi:hypothetical protein BH11MYX1_BH11MYX1_00690 [soil metagenome]
MERVLFFSPHAGIWQHAFPEALVAESVRRAGGDVVQINCDGGFSGYCVVMGSRGLREASPWPDKAKVCTTCRHNRNLIRQDVGLRSYDYDSVLGPADERRIVDLVERARPDQITELVIDGIRVGQAALYEYLIAHKRAQGGFSAAEWLVFKPRLENVVRSLLAAQKIIDREKPTRIAIYNTLYSVNAMWRAVGDQRNIPVYVLHAGPSLATRLRTLMIARDSTTLAMYRLVATSHAQLSLPANGDELAAVTDHFVEVLRGQNVFAYSAAKSHEDWRSRLGIRADQKLLVATMSSYDEYVAARAVGEQPGEEGLLFATQIEWISALVAWIRDRPELFLLIRVHPREFPNKREATKSQHAQLLEQALVELPANVRVNWPDDKLSLYDIAEYAEVVLNAWSSAGKEMALLGRPVIVYCPSLLMYAPAINMVAVTLATYFAAIETALHEPWNFERIRAAYRWCAVEYVRSIVSIADGFDYSEQRATTLLGRARNAAFAVPGIRQAYDLWNRPRDLAAGARIAEVLLGAKASLLDVPDPRSEVTITEETTLIRIELARLYQVLYGARPAPPGTLQSYLYDVSR